MGTTLTVEQFKRALPQQLSKKVNQEVMDNINLVLSDSNHAEMLRENIIGYAHVLQDGKFSMQQYVDAVKYVSYKMMGNTNIAAFSKTFPDRYQKYLENGTSDKDIASYVTAYNKNKLVNLIYEQTLVPSYILNADIYQKAINVQAALMNDDSVSPKVRSDAANSLLTHLKRPEAQKVELSVGIQESSALQELKDVTAELAAKMHRSIESGVYTPKEIAHKEILLKPEEYEVQR